MSSMEEEDPRQPADGQAHLEASSSREREGVRNVDGERESARSQGMQLLHAQERNCLVLIHALNKQK